MQRSNSAHRASASTPFADLERTALALGLVQLLLHLAFTLASNDPRILVPHLVSWIQDLVLLSLAVLLAVGLGSISGPSWGSRVMAAAWCALLALGALLAVYPRMLQSSLAFPVNLFNTDLGAATVFLRDYAGLRALWPAAMALCAGCVAPRLTFLRLPHGPIVLGILLVLAIPTLIPQAPNPIVFSIQDRLADAFRSGTRAVPRLVPGGAPEAGGFAPAPSPLEADRPPIYDHIVLVVLEGITADAFESEFLGTPGGFSERNAGRARYFRNYWATNLDSYPSLIAMTTSVQVPFRAYADPALYEGVNDLPNAPRALRKKGYRTLFVSTYEHQPFVPNRTDWDRVTDRKDLPSLEGWTSLGGSRMESATEDRAAIPLILQHAVAAPRSFILSELAYGHTPEWRARTGVTQLAYCDAYLSELAEGLTGAGVAERTLIVVVSDHGERSGPSRVENYRVPLLIVGRGVAPGEDTVTRSHLDLQGLIAHFTMGTPLPPARNRLATVGSTERWIYGEIVPPLDHLFIDDTTGRVLGRGGALEPMDVHRRFQELLDLAERIRTWSAAM